MGKHLTAYFKKN